MRTCLQLKPGVEVSSPAAGRTAVVADGQPIVQTEDEPGEVVDALLALGAAPVPEHELNARVLEAGGVEALLRWQHLLALCVDGGAIEYRVEAAGRWLATVIPASPGAAAPAIASKPARMRRLSRFACLRRSGTRIIVESPLAPVAIALSPDALTAVATASIGEGSESSLDERAAATLAAVLDQYRLLDRADEAAPDVDASAAAQPSPAEQVWEFHDALFHHASRLRAGARSGATWRLRDRLPPWPALKSGGTGPRTILPPVDLDALERTDPPLAAVSSRRRSIREAAAPLTLGQLSEFLARSWRIRSVEHRGGIDALRRDAPSAGGLYALEAYISVRRCAGLAPASYWYDGWQHALEQMNAAADVTGAVIDQAPRSWGRTCPPPDVFITIGARVPRVAWKYEGNAYRVVLLDAGVMIHAMYLAATAMGLSPCAVGNGDPSLFAALTGRDPFEETSVGEFALSGRAR